MVFPLDTAMENSLDVTTITTLQLLESRLLHLEQMVYGISPTDPPTSNEVSVARQLENLERRFRALLSRVRVYNDIHKIRKWLLHRKVRSAERLDLHTPPIHTSLTPSQTRRNPSYLTSPRPPNRPATSLTRPYAP